MSKKVLEPIYEARVLDWFWLIASVLFGRFRFRFAGPGKMLPITLGYLH